MAKKVKVMDKRKIRGIRRRWLINLSLIHI